MKNKKIISLLLVFSCILICIFSGIKVYHIYYLKNNSYTGLIRLEEREKINKSFIKSINETGSGERIYCIDDECGITAN